MLEEIASWTMTSYVGLWRFMQLYVKVSGKVYKNSVIKKYWCSKQSFDALSQCMGDLLSPGNETIDSVADPITLLKTAIPLCNGFNEDYTLKEFEYKS